MKVFITNFLNALYTAIPYTLIFLVLMETILVVTSDSHTAMVFHAAAATLNGLVLYYYQTRG